MVIGNPEDYDLFVNGLVAINFVEDAGDVHKLASWLMSDSERETCGKSLNTPVKIGTLVTC